MLELNDELRSAIAGRASTDQLEDIAVKSGMIPLKKAGMSKALEGITTVEEILRVCG